jgi:hypothetical protein
MRITQVYLLSPAANTTISNAAGTTSAGYTKWIPHDYWQTPTSVTLAGFLATGASLTWEVQYTCDDITAAHPVTASQTTTTITVTDYGPPLGPFGSAGPNGHGLLAGDYVNLFGLGSGMDGEYNVTSVTSTTVYTVTSATSQSATAGPGAAVISARVFVHPSLSGQTSRATGNYAYPVRASRLVVTAVTTAGPVYLEVLQGGMST